MKRASYRALRLRVRTILWLEGGYVPKHGRGRTNLLNHAVLCGLELGFPRWQWPELSPRRPYLAHTYAKEYGTKILITEGRNGPPTQY